MSGDAQRAIRIFEADLEKQGRLPAQLSHLAVAYYRASQRENAQELLSELEAMADVKFFSPGLLAAVYFAAGDADSGFASLQHAVDAKARGVIFLRVSYMMDGRRDDPRYKELIRSVGFSPAQ